MNAPAAVPGHVAIIMDGNGRWATGRGLARTEGHQAGAEALRRTLTACGERNIPALTVFAFSSENWRRPAGEVSRLMDLFFRSLNRDVGRLHENGVRIRFLGDTSAFSGPIQAGMKRAEKRTRENRRLQFNVAVNYGGRWDIVQAARAVIRGQSTSSDPESLAESLSEQSLAAHLSLADLPEPDLFIRTGGERRISNFLLWQLAYTELHFTPVLWPDFDAEHLDEALDDYAGRERRFGRVGAHA